MPATEVDLTNYRPFFLCKLNLVREIVLMALRRAPIPQQAQAGGAMVSVAPASRRPPAHPLTSNIVGELRRISAGDRNSGVAR
jgi:hypothetical protein